MLTIGITFVQLDTLETDLTIHFQRQERCPACRKPINIYIVRLGSQGDQALTRQTAQDLDMQISHAVKSFLGMPKSIRIRLKPQHIFSLRNRLPLYPKAPCPVCRQTLDLCLQSV